MAAQPQTLKHLDRALALLQERRAEDALQELLEAWRAMRAPEIAELISTLSDRLAKTRAPLDTRSLNEGLTRWLAISRQDDPADLGRLLDAYEVAAKKQIHTRFLVPRLDEILRRGDDPRVVLPLVRTLDVLPLVSHATQIAHRVFRGLLIADDPRAIPLLAGRLSSWRDMTIPPHQYGDPVRVYVLERGGEALEKLRTRHPDGAPRLAEGAVANLEALAVTIGSLRKDLVPRAVDPTKRSVEELFAAVYQSPDDDELRDVLADALQLRQDPRGEFIALQMARLRAQPDPGPSSREEALLRKHRKQWLGLLAGSVHPKEHVFRRGFLDECHVRFRNAAHARAEANHPEWATVRAIQFHKGTTHEDQWSPHAVVTPAMRSLRSVRGVAEPCLTALCASRPPHLKELWVELYGWPRQDLRSRSPLLMALAATPFPELRALVLNGPSWDRIEGPDGPETVPRTAEDYRLLASAPWASTLRRLTLPAEPSTKFGYVQFALFFPQLEVLAFHGREPCPVRSLEPVADGIAASVWLLGRMNPNSLLAAPIEELEGTATQLSTSLRALVRAPRLVELRLRGPSLRAPESERRWTKEWAFEHTQRLAEQALAAVAHRPDLRVFGPDGARLDAGGRSP
jgi:uncharacterized protein (TIGR02996 family)